jgi:hypothetical protein
MVIGLPFRASRFFVAPQVSASPWNNGYVESFNRRLRIECLNRNHWTSLLEARVDRGLQNRPQPAAPALGPGLPDPGRVRCGLHLHPPPGGLRDRLNTDHNDPDSITGVPSGSLSLRSARDDSRVRGTI